MSERSGLSRRELLLGTGVGTVGAAAITAGGAGAVAALPSRETGRRVNGVPTTVLPRGRREVPIFGVGCAYVGGLVEQGRREEAIRVLRHAYEKGMRYFDSATLYPTDPIAAEALQPFIEDIYLTTRSPARPPDPARVAREHLEIELKRYGTDVIDCFKVHNAHDYDQAMRAIEELEKQRELGKVRQIGVSTHVHFETVYRLIDTGRLDQVLLGLCYFPKGYYQLLSHHNLSWRERCVARAHELGMNVIGMKCLGGVLFTRNPGDAPSFDEAKRRQLPGAAIRWGYSDPRVTLYNIGISSTGDVDDNLQLFAGDMTFTNADRRLLAEYSTALWGIPLIRAMEEPYRFPGDEAYLDKDMDWLFSRMKEVEKELVP